jgi:predicted transcriptional regulator
MYAMSELDKKIYQDWMQSGSTYFELATRHNISKTQVANSIRRGLANRKLGIFQTNELHIVYSAPPDPHNAVRQAVEDSLRKSG